MHVDGVGRGQGEIRGPRLGEPGRAWASVTLTGALTCRRYIQILDCTTISCYHHTEDTDTRRAQA
jgi:hypothetical protein